MNSLPDKSKVKFTYRYLSIVSLITALLGLFLLFFPSIIVDLFFNNSDSPINFFVRMLGSTLVGYGTLCFLAIRSKSIEVYKVAVWSNLSTLIVATVVSFIYLNDYAGYWWLVIGQHLIFTGGFLCCAWELSKIEKL